MSSSLLQGVLKQSAAETADKNVVSPRMKNLPLNDRDDSDEELVNVVSLPGTPARSRQSSRPSSPTRGAAGRPAPGPLLLSGRKSSTDPLRALPTELSQRIFRELSIRDLTVCARVSRKWGKSQTINYVWFQHYRKASFHDESLPPGKWTKRESKQNWSSMYAQYILREAPTGPVRPLSRSSDFSSGSGYQTPREVREEKWRQEAEVVEKPGKVEMREMYKELGGRKSRTKGKLGGTAGARDKGGWGDAADEDW